MDITGYISIVKPCVHDARNRSEISDEERIDQSQWSCDQIIQI